MRVRSIMRWHPQFCSLETNLAMVGKKMEQANCGFLPVVGEGGRVVGVVTDRDVCLALARLDRRPSTVEAREVMSKELCCCLEEGDIRDALRLMRDRLVRRLPVVDHRQQLLGVLSLDDVALAARAFESEGFNGPFYPDVALTLQSICAGQATATV